MKELLFWRCLVDFGLLILIWLVQLIVYPSFTYMNDKDLLRWHTPYTKKITVIVMPLMLSQLALSIAAIYLNPITTHITHLIVVILCWIITFGKAVPLHAQLDQQVNPAVASRDLVRVNWPRTVLWSLTFLISLIAYLR